MVLAGSLGVLESDGPGDTDRDFKAVAAKNENRVSRVNSFSYPKQ